MLNNMKKKLGQLTSEALFFQDELQEKKALLMKSEGDLTKVVEERDGAKKENKRLRILQSQSSKAVGTAGDRGDNKGIITCSARLPRCRTNTDCSSVN